jgi:indole-3-glycerol phosphate synthase
MNILNDIVATKKADLEKLKARMPISELEKLPLFNKPCYSLKRFLVDRSRNGIIAEFKRCSPSKGNINIKANVARVTEAYAANSASAISILTDTFYFGGSIDDMISARANSVPILRKDFIVDEYQVVESKAYGADVILLIAAVLSPEEVRTLSSLAHQLGLEVILEVHNEKELGHIAERTDIIGVNNRDLTTFEVSLDTSVHLAHLIPPAKLKISESGIHSIKDIVHLKQLGYNGFLIGEQFMKETDPGLAYMKFAAQLNEELQ